MPAVCLGVLDVARNLADWSCPMLLVRLLAYARSGSASRALPLLRERKAERWPYSSCAQEMANDPRHTPRGDVYWPGCRTSRSSTRADDFRSPSFSPAASDTLLD